MESTYAYSKAVTQWRQYLQPTLADILFLSFCHDILESMSSRLYLLLQLLTHLFSVSGTVFLSQNLAPAILLPEILHSAPPSLGQLFSSFHANLYIISTIRSPQESQRASILLLPRSCTTGHAECKLDHGTVQSEGYTNSLTWSFKDLWFRHASHSSIILFSFLIHKHSILVLLLVLLPEMFFPGSSS